jgi:hypothetical protein
MRARSPGPDNDRPIFVVVVVEVVGAARMSALEDVGDGPPAVAGLFSMFAVGMGWATIHCVNLARDEYRPSVLRRVSW